MSLEGIPFVKGALSSQIGGAGFFQCREVSNMDLDALVLDRGAELPSAQRNAKNPKCIVGLCGLPVLDVKAMGHISKIGDPVVPSITIDMVNDTSWPDAMHIQPRESMRPVEFTLDAYEDIAVSFVLAANCFACFPPTCIKAPREDSGFGFVVKQFAQTFGGKIGFAHAVVPLKRWFGKWSSAVSAAGLCAFGAILSALVPTVGVV